MSLGREDKPSVCNDSNIFLRSFNPESISWCLLLFENSLHAAEFWDMVSWEEIKQLQQIKQMGINAGEPPKHDPIVH